ncbi:MAG: pitrilysin family protein [bacterium]|nr:pitrilysin family protein [bacterium]
MARVSGYQRTALPGGLRVVTERMPGVRSAALGIWVTVGSRHETADENGTSHFIEHMAFKGTAARSALDIARTIECGGGMINAFTGKELTCFHVHVLDEKLPEAFDLLADILRNSLFDPAEIEKEKRVVLDEIRDHEDMPDDVAHEFFMKSLFHAHSLSRPILGTPDNVRSFSREQLLKFIGAHYTPTRIVVTAAGNVRHARLLAQVERSLHLPPAKRMPAGGRVSALRPGVERHQRPIQQAHMLIGTRGLPYAHRDRFTLSVLNTLLGGGMSSRFFQNIREKHGVAYAIYSFAEMMRDTGVWATYLATDPERVDRARDLVLEELKSLRDRGASANEVEGVKTQLKGNIMLGLENVSSRMMRLGRMEVYLRRFSSLDDVIRHIDRVTPRAVQTLANRLLDERKLITTIVEPEKTKRRAVRKSVRS